MIFAIKKNKNNEINGQYAVIRFIIWTLMMNDILCNFYEITGQMINEDDLSMVMGGCENIPLLDCVIQSITQIGPIYTYNCLNSSTSVPKRPLGAAYSTWFRYGSLLAYKIYSKFQVSTKIFVKDRNVLRNVLQAIHSSAKL